jgi:hypothetical protein
MINSTLWERFGCSELNLLESAINANSNIIFRSKIHNVILTGIAADKRARVNESGQF